MTRLSSYDALISEAGKQSMLREVERENDEVLKQLAAQPLENSEGRAFNIIDMVRR